MNALLIAGVLLALTACAVGVFRVAATLNRLRASLVANFVSNETVTRASIEALEGMRTALESRTEIALRHFPPTPKPPA